MASRIRTLAASLVTSIAAWGSLPANITVSRRRSVSVILDDLDDNAGEIAVICPRTEDTSNRADVSEDITIGIVLLVRCTGEAATASDTYEDFLEALCDHLRTSSTFKAITLSGNLAARRRTVGIITPCDADTLDQHEVFVGVIEGVWAVSVGNRA